MRSRPTGGCIIRAGTAGRVACGRKSNVMGKRHTPLGRCCEKPPAHRNPTEQTPPNPAKNRSPQPPASIGPPLASLHSVGSRFRLVSSVCGRCYRVKSVLLTLVLLLSAFWWACVVKTPMQPASGPSQNTTEDFDEWRRTAHGWERRSDWTVPSRTPSAEPEPMAAFHPLLLSCPARAHLLWCSTLV